MDCDCITGGTEYCDTETEITGNDENEFQMSVVPKMICQQTAD